MAKSRTRRASARKAAPRTTGKKKVPRRARRAPRPARRPARTARKGSKATKARPSKASRASKARKAKGLRAAARKLAPSKKANYARQAKSPRTAKKAAAKPRTKAVVVVAKPRKAPKPSVTPVPAPKAATPPLPAAAAPKPAATPRSRAPKPKPAFPPPGLHRERRRLPEAEAFPTPPSSLDLAVHPSAARSGQAGIQHHLADHPEAGPALTGGDLDANWEAAYSSGDEAPGGDNPTPDQDIVDQIGKSLGVEYEDDEELKGAAKLEERDKHRWELDPASSEDYEDR
jgi:hypothetical protein